LGFTFESGAALTPGQAVGVRAGVSQVKYLRTDGQQSRWLWDGTLCFNGKARRTSREDTEAPDS